MFYCYGTVSCGASNVLYTRSLNVKVSSDVGTGRYCLWGGSYQEMVYCIVLNSKFTHQGLSSKRFKLLKVRPFQIKPKLLRVIVNSWACQVCLIICTLGIFFLITVILRRRSTSKINVTHTCCTVQGNKYDV